MTLVATTQKIKREDGTWEYVQTPVGNTGGVAQKEVYIQDEEPTNVPEGTLWLNTSKDLPPSDIPDWAKQPEKPTYTAEEVGALPADTIIPPVPDTLPNPFALNFTGAVEGSYDGSKALTVNIPMGGGSDKWEFIGEFNVGEEDVAEWIISEDAEGKPIELKEMYFSTVLQPSPATTENTALIFGNPALGMPFSTNAYYASVGAALRTTINRVGMNVSMVPQGDEFTMLALYFPGLLGVTWQQGRSNAGGAVYKHCFGGVAMRSGKASTGLIGANSTVKIWGVRI